MYLLCILLTIIIILLLIFHKSLISNFDGQFEGGNLSVGDIIRKYPEYTYSPLPMQQKDHHIYYDPAVKTSMIDDVLASYLPNDDLRNAEFGRSRDFITNYKYNILRRNQEYAHRDKVQRAWWT
jgi:hypothetical protein